MNAQKKAIEKGANILKQWDATLDARTRSSHAKVDGELREYDEKFSNGLLFPSDPNGSAEEVINCRCTVLQRAKWELDEEELQILKERAEFFGLDKTDNFEDFKKKYLKAVDNSGESGIIKSLDVDDFKTVSEIKGISNEISDIITNTIKDFEEKGNMFISDAHFGDFYDEVSGSPALFQITINNYGLTDININARILNGRTLEEVNSMIAKTRGNLPENITEAVVHECGHAKAYYGKTITEIEKMNTEIKNKGVSGISYIAETDGAECIAEVEVLLYRGEKVPEQAMELYNKYVKGH